MARIELVSDEQAKENPVVAEFFRGATELVGRIPNAARAYARIPSIAAWQLALTSSLQREGGGGRLDGRMKQLVVLATSAANQCAYCTTHNKALGAATGLTEAQVDAIVNGSYGDPGVFEPREVAAIRWAEAVTKNEAQRDNAAFEELSKWFDDTEMLEITWLCGLFNMFNKVHDALWLDIETSDEVNKIKRSAVVSEAAVARYAANIAATISAQVDQVGAGV